MFYMWASEIKQSALPASSFFKIAKDCVRQQRSLLFVLRVGKKEKKICNWEKKFNIQKPLNDSADCETNLAGSLWKYLNRNV